MKHTFQLLLICLGLSLAFVSCKKGEDDPAFTLLTRKERVSGNWTMQSAAITLGIKDSSGAYASLIYQLDGSNYSKTNTGLATVWNGKSTLSLSFTKKGAFTITQDMDSLNLQSSGIWDFEGKIGKSKNKESMIIKLNSVQGNTDRIDFFNKGSFEFVYRIKELRSKKMVLVSEQEMLALEHSAGVYVTAEYTFTQ